MNQVDYYSSSPVQSDNLEALDEVMPREASSKGSVIKLPEPFCFPELDSKSVVLPSRFESS